jgi:transposase
MRTLTLNNKHLRRAEILTQLISGKLSTPEAAQLLGITTRQVRRLRHRFTTEGVESVVHANTGRAPQNRTDPILIERLHLLAGRGSIYHDFNVSHLSEVLARDQEIDLARSTLSRLLFRHGIRPRQTSGPQPKRMRRERRSQEGAMLQIDGSPHDWLEGRSARMALVGAIDDATGKIIYASFRLTEDQAGYLIMLRSITQEYGLPQAIYHDRHTILRSPKEPTLEEELLGKPPQSQVQRVMQELGISSIAALSAQGKGRVERLWRTLQDRLVKEMRLSEVTTLSQANSFLPNFISSYNARFALEARDLEKAWCALPKDFDFDYYFATRALRLVKRDHTLQWQGQCLQLMVDQRTPSLANKRISVHQTPEGEINLYAEKRRLSYRIVESTERRSQPAASVDVAQTKMVDPQVKAAAQARRRGWLFTTHP